MWTAADAPALGVLGQLEGVLLDDEDDEVDPEPDDEVLPDDEDEDEELSEEELPDESFDDDDAEVDGDFLPESRLSVR